VLGHDKKLFVQVRIIVWECQRQLPIEAIIERFAESADVSIEDLCSPCDTVSIND